MFEALKLCRPQDVSAVILGQDPYHGAGEATGLAFAVEQGVKLPPSLKNIFKELKNDLETDFSPRSDLKDWAAQGVLLLNSFLTVAKDSPGSHKELGWEKFTDGIISYLSAFKRPKVFVLWGNFAQSKRRLIDESENLVISSPHPSPLSASRGFFGSKPFSRTNAFLRENGQKQVMWVRDF